VRFTVLGHGALFVEHPPTSTSILIDPWLGGSCYWRSWWHYPPSEASEAHLRPTHVYLTHHHFDHFHYPSMRRLDKGAHVLIPRFGVDVMPGEVRSLGFSSVTELPHGEVTTLAPGLRVASYQYGFDDSAFVIASDDDGTVLADLNDCKMRGASLQQVLDDFGPPTFLFKSHSWAQAYPVHYAADDPSDLAVLSRDSYAADFLAIVREMRPRYAVPFASMTCFLHPETADVNDHIVTPVEVRDAFDSAGGVDGVELKVLVPGDSWSSDAGFDVAEHDWYSRRAEHLAVLTEKARPTVDAAMAEEASTTVQWPAFAAHMQRFVDALPPGAGRVLLKRPVVFEVPSDAATRWWVVDGRAGRVYRSATLPDDHASIVRVPEAVLADAVGKDLVNLIHISMRMRVELRPGGVDTDLAFWALMAVHELGYLPLRRVLTPRMAGVAWRRRRELLGMVTGRLFGKGTLAERMTGGLGAVSGGGPTPS
jgi:UDP-MurNAc hydroxylase